MTHRLDFWSIIRENAFGDRDWISFSSKTKKAEDGLRCVLSEGNTLFRPRWYDCRNNAPRSARWPIGIAAFGLFLPFLIKNSGLARESAGNNCPKEIQREIKNPVIQKKVVIMPLSDESYSSTILSTNRLIK
ncbi:hypothetical protein NE237_028805 [Protea cynaroides]|uniref:Uncharacterized protein n=1 Tax=Protea cynaroides TaxID=273540 RepID=A0A9Q0GQN0_9MAGN|nr:hypothetical protein NE237_028805 [Protea cynaroides]